MCPDWFLRLPLLIRSTVTETYNPVRRVDWILDDYPHHHAEQRVEGNAFKLQDLPALPGIVPRSEFFGADYLIANYDLSALPSVLGICRLQRFYFDRVLIDHFCL